MYPFTFLANVYIFNMAMRILSVFEYELANEYTPHPFPQFSYAGSRILDRPCEVSGRCALAS